MQPSLFGAPNLFTFPTRNDAQAPAQNQHVQWMPQSSQGGNWSSNYSVPPQGGLHFAGLSPFAFQNPVYYTNQESEPPSYTPQPYLNSIQPPAFNFLNNFDFKAEESPPEAMRTPEAAREHISSARIPNVYAPPSYPVDKPTATILNPGYDPEDNGTRVLTNGMHNYTNIPATRILNAPTQLGSMPLPPQQHFEHIGDAAANNDDPNRIPTFVKVRGLPSAQDPRIVARKKKSKKKSWICNC